MREYGDPDGFPVVYNHGGLLCGADVAPANEVARRMGVRLIAPNRPGVGLSTQSPGRSVANWLPDMEELLAERGVMTFSALGWSMGGPYALALAPLAQRIAVVGCTLPLSGRHLSEVNRTDRLLTRLSRRVPLAARGGFKAMRVGAGLVPRVTREMVRGEDAEILPSLEGFGQWMNEGLAQPDGMVGEYTAISGSWGFALGSVSCPVVVWQGDEDALVPATWARELTLALPSAQIREVVGAGHFLAYRRWDAVLGSVLP